MAELCSAYPTSGGCVRPSFNPPTSFKTPLLKPISSRLMALSARRLYYWAAKIGGKHGRFASWMTGWCVSVSRGFVQSLAHHVTSFKVQPARSDLHNILRGQCVCVKRAHCVAFFYIHCLTSSRLVLQPSSGRHKRDRAAGRDGHLPVAAEPARRHRARLGPGVGAAPADLPPRPVPRGRQLQHNHQRAGLPERHRRHRVLSGAFRFFS